MTEENAAADENVNSDEEDFLENANTDEGDGDAGNQDDDSDSDEGSDDEVDYKAEAEKLRADNERLADEQSKLEKESSNHQEWRRKKELEAENLRQANADLKRKQPKPEVLETVPGFEEGVNHLVNEELDKRDEVRRAEESNPDRQKKLEADWTQNMFDAHPDFEELSKANKDFHVEVQEGFDSLGDDAWDHAKSVALVTEIKRTRAKRAASNADAKADKKAKLESNEIPAGKKAGGLGGGSGKKPDKEKQRFENMTLAEIEAEGQRVALK